MPVPSTHPLHRPAVFAVTVLLLAAPAAAEPPLTLSAHVGDSVLRLKFAVAQNATTAFSQVVVLRRKSASEKFTRVTVKASLALADADGISVLLGGTNGLEVPAGSARGLASGTLELALPAPILPNDEFCIAVDVNGARQVLAGGSAFVLRMIGAPRPAEPAQPEDAGSTRSPAAEQRLAACRAALPPKPAQR